MEKMEIARCRAKCHSVLKRVQKTGEPILITRLGEPVAQLLPPPPPKRSKRLLGAMAGTGRILGDIVSPVVPESDWEVLR